MLEMLLDKKLLFVLMGILTGLGVVDKCIVSMMMKRMVEAAGSMSKSNHPLMRLVRAKFEHACMISDTVENVGVFVDKYLYEYKVCGLRLHTLRRLEKICAGLLIVTGLVGAGLSYQVYGMGDAVLRMGACGAGLGILVWLFHLTTDENYCMQMAKNYMVDYLENVCLHKYEKANQKERTGRRDSVIKKDETNDTKEEKAEKEDKTEQEEKEESVPVSGSGVVQMQRESRRKERVKENARNLAKASARLACTDGSKRTEDILQEEVQSTGTLAGNAQAMEIKGNADKESAQEDVQEEIPKEDTIRELPKDEMIRQILREFMA